MNYFISAPAPIETIPAATLDAIISQHGSYEALNEKLAAGCNLPEQIEAFEALFCNGELDQFAGVNLTLYSGDYATEVMTGVPVMYQVKELAAMATKVNGIEYVALDVDRILAKDMSVEQLRVSTLLVLEHECVHIEQMKRGDLVMDATGVTWKGELYSAASLQAEVQACGGDAYLFTEQQTKLPWETEAYARSMPWTLLENIKDAALKRIFVNAKKAFEIDV